MKGCVLLVEDDRFLRRAAELRLRRDGYTVVTAADGEEALRVVADAAPNLILLDLITPRIQGFEVLRRLKAAEGTRHIPVIVFTNLSQDADRKRVMDDGAAGFIVKAETSLDELVRTVDAAMQRSAA